MKKLLITLVFIFASSSADVYALCDRESSNTFAINACSEEDYKTAELKLNKIYKLVLQELSENSTDKLRSVKTKKHLVAAQRAWLVFRENECLAADLASGNATLRTSYFGCMQQHAESRTKELQDCLGN